MSILERLQDPAQWELFYTYKESHGHLRKSELEAFRQYLSNQGYSGIVQKIIDCKPFSPPKKSLIRKLDTSKKRTVYTFPHDENMVLKLLTYLLLRRYDHVFSDNLYSFRMQHGAKEAMKNLLKTPDLSNMYTYKVDISNYFNSVNLDKLFPILRETLSDDPLAYNFLEQLLSNPYVDDGTTLKTEEKGIMAGTPPAVFLANLYLKELDAAMIEQGIQYYRYSDDILVLAKSLHEREEIAQLIQDFLSKYSLSINEKKEERTAPHEVWSFLGVQYQNGIVDISDISIQKIKGKIRRKMRALIRWKARKNATFGQAVTALIRSMNRKFFHAGSANELTWACWYFPMINTDKSIKIIDQYLQQCIRYLATGTHSKAQYRFTYEQMKDLGYRSLVHEWYEKKTLS